MSTGDNFLKIDFQNITVALRHIHEPHLESVKKKITEKSVYVKSNFIIADTCLIAGIHD